MAQREREREREREIFKIKTVSLQDCHFQLNVGLPINDL